MTAGSRHDLTLQVNAGNFVELSNRERQQAAEWIVSHLDTAPASIRPSLDKVVEKLRCGRLTGKAFDVYWNELGRALGFIRSSERRRSGHPLQGVKSKRAPKPKTERERLEQQQARSNELVDRYRDLQRKNEERAARLAERLRTMASDPKAELEEVSIPALDDMELSAEEKAACSREAAEQVDRLGLGDGADPRLQGSKETLMTGEVVSVYDDRVFIEAELPEGVTESDVVKTMIDNRVRYDFSVSVTRLELDVEKKVVVTEHGERQVISASTSAFGPARYSVTWSALATLAVMVGQFAMPLNRLATLLTTAVKRFTSASLSRMAHYVAQRLVPIYLELGEQLSDASILAGDDTSCRVIEVSSYFANAADQKKQHDPPWSDYRTAEAANQTYECVLKSQQALDERRAEGERSAKRATRPEPPLTVLVGREFDFESPKRDGSGAKQGLNTTVVTGRSHDDDPNSMIVFYRSHLGSFGNVLEMLLEKRAACASTLMVQADLSSSNHVTDPTLLERFDLKYIGCMAHARRPFAQYEEQDPVFNANMLTLFQGLALNEQLLDEHGRNRENVLAVRNIDSRRLWNLIKKHAATMAQKWSKATPLGTAARYIIKHFNKLTAYLDDPRLEATNNLRERMLRTEKLIEKNSLFRQTVEGRTVLDILRTVLQTAVAAGVPAHEYLVDVLQADPEKVTNHPERYTPRAWALRRTDQEVLRLMDTTAA